MPKCSWCGRTDRPTEQIWAEQVCDLCEEGMAKYYADKKVPPIQPDQIMFDVNGQFYALECGICHMRGPGAADPLHAYLEAKYEGWYLKDGELMCKVCKEKQAKQLGGDVL